MRSFRGPEWLLTLGAIEIWAVLIPLDTKILNHVKQWRCPIWFRKHFVRAWPRAALSRAEPVLLHPRQFSGGQTPWPGGQCRCFWCSQKHLLGFGQDKVRFTSESDSSVLRGTCNVVSTEVSPSGPSRMSANEKGADWVHTGQVGGKVPGTVVPSGAPYG